MFCRSNQTYSGVARTEERFQEDDMENQPKNNIEIIQTANKEMLDYFNSSFLHELETIQDLKTQAFEIDIKIDELEKTKDIYAFKSNSRKSVFTPIMNDSTDQERGKIIDAQVRDLKDVKQTLTNKIHSLENDLAKLKKRLSILSDAEEAIKQISGTYIEPKSVSGDTGLDGFEFVEEPASPDLTAHGYNILMQDAFDKAYMTTLIDKNVKDNLTGMQHKLEMLSYLLSTDIGRAKLTLQEINLSSRKIMDALDDVCEKLDYHLDSSKPIWDCVDDFMMKQRELHPEVIIDSKIECEDYDISLHPVFTINLIKLLTIFFDNIFKHSNANSVEFRISITPNIIDVRLTDNGIGIHADYLAESPWYSSLHKAHEVIYLLGGKLEISGDVVSGTQIRFSFPIHI